MGALCNLLESCDERMAIHKNTLVPYWRVVEGKVVAKSGSQIISEVTNRFVTEFEYSNKSLDNNAWAIYRQLSAKQEPDPIHVDRFDMMTTRIFDHFCPKMMKDAEPKGFMMDYPAGQEAWTINKIENYESNIVKSFNDPTFVDYLQSFRLMVKSGEVQRSDYFELDEDGYIKGQSSRPRCVMNPAKLAQGLMQALQQEIFPLLREHFPGFI